MCKSVLYLMILVLSVGLAGFANGQLAASPTPTMPKRSGEFEFKGILIDTFVPHATGGKIKFKREGKIQVADLAQARVYSMRSGRKVVVPKAQWKTVLRKGARTDLRVRLTDSASYLAIIAIVTG